MQEHECYIGEWLDYEDTALVTLNELITKINTDNSTFDFALDTYGKEFTDGFLKKKDINDYFDKRKNINLIRFDYCPYCGKQINWKELRKVK